MYPNLKSPSVTKRSNTEADNRLSASKGDTRAAGIVEKQRTRLVDIFRRQQSPRKVHKGVMETAKVSDSTLDVDPQRVSRYSLSLPIPALHRWGSLTSQESYKGASSKLEHELRKCLGSEHDEEVLMKSYSCAMQKDILVHGRLYITQKWFCFYSNILGFETKTCISCMDVTAVRKHKTAKLIPNAIQIETGDKTYGFSSFYHRDKTYLVLITVWQNALTRDPLSVESLKQELKTLKVTKEQEKLIMGRRSKSASITSDDVDTSVASVADSTSCTPPVHPDIIRHSSSDTVTNPTEDSDLGGEGEKAKHFQSYHNIPRQSHTRNSSPSSSRSGSPSEEDSNGSDSSKSGGSDVENEPRGREEVDSLPKNGVKSHGIPRSPSLVTLRSESPREKSVAGGILRGGGRNTNLLYHWKQIWSFLSRGVTLVRPVEVVRKPVRILSMCSTSQFINFFISIAIIFMFVYMLTMFCHLSQVNPSLQPYLKYQPWCSLCSLDYPPTTAAGSSAPFQDREQLSMLSRLLLPTTTSSSDSDCSQSISFKSPCPSVLPTT